MRTFGRHAWLCAAAILLLTPRSLPAQTRPNAGYVTSLEGRWFVSSRPTEPIGIWKRIFDGDTIWADEGNDAGDRLNIVLYGDAAPVELRCTGRGECARRVIEAHPPRGAVARLLDDMPWNRPPLRFRPTITRGDDFPEIREAVLTRSAAGLDLGPLLRFAPPGEWRLEASPVDSAGRLGTPLPIRVAWQPGRPALVPPGVLPGPGLYAVSFADDAADAWVLVVQGSGGAADTGGRFQELEAALGQWTAGSVYADGRSLLRAYLYQVAFGADQTASVP